MKRFLIACLWVFSSTSPAIASQLNLEPYFSVGSTSMSADIGGNTSSAPSYYFAAGSTLNWISPNIGAEFRFGFGGQYTTFNGDVNTYTSYLFKPSFDVTRQIGVYGLAGVSTMSVTVANVNYSDSGLSYGAGFVYHIPNESLSVTGEWMNYHTSSDQNTASLSGMDITGISLGITFDYY